MNEIISKEYTLDSREAAKMVDKNHAHLLRDIKGYIEELTKSNFGFSDFFQESQYKDKSGKTNLRYDITRKGCEFIANKLTGQKGTMFTASYINRFHEMEQKIQQPIPKLPMDKNKRLEIQEKNARAKTATLYLRIAENTSLPQNYRGIFLSYASKELSGQELLPLPKAERKTYSAADIGSMFGLSSNKIGRLTNEYNLKTEEYGMLYHDKSRHSVKEVDTFRYFDTVIPKIQEITGVMPKIAN